MRTVASGPIASCVENPDEKNVSAQQPQAQAQSWFSRPDGDPRRPQGPQRPSCQGPQASVRLTTDHPQPPSDSDRETTPGLAFPRSARLTKAAEFNRVFRTAAIRRRGGTLRISAVSNRMHGARLGLVVGKRALPRAHDRNRAKRVLRETFRQRRPELPAMDIVVQVTGAASNAEYRRAFEALLMQLTDREA